MTPVESTRGIGVWGTVGQGRNDTSVHYCVPGSCLVGLYPNVAKDAQNYLRAGRLWEVAANDKGKHRLIRLQLNHWNPDNPRTCPKCKEKYLLLMEQRAGLQHGKADDAAGATVG